MSLPAPIFDPKQFPCTYRLPLWRVICIAFIGVCLLALALICFWMSFWSPALFLPSALAIAGIGAGLALLSVIFIVYLPNYQVTFFADAIEVRALGWARRLRRDEIEGYRFWGSQWRTPPPTFFWCPNKSM